MYREGDRQSTARSGPTRTGPAVRIEELPDRADRGETVSLPHSGGKECAETEETVTDQQTRAGITAPQAPPITPRRAATRRRLLTAASTVIAERGVHGASVEAICEEAGFTRGAFYSNFATKEALIAALMESKRATLLEGVRQVLEESERTPLTPGTDVIDDLVEKVIAANPVDRQSHLVESEISLFMIRNPQHAPQLRTTMAPFRDELGRLLVAGLSRAGRHLILDVEAAVSAVLAAYSCGATEVMTAAATGHPDQADSCRQTLALMIKTISAPDRP